MTNSKRAVDLITNGMVIGLGTGRAASAFIEQLGERVRGGLRVSGVPTSQASADLARRFEIPLRSLDEVEGLDMAVDGADEVAPNLDLVKGYGGALVREKIVAASAGRFVVLVGAEKLVPALGHRGRLPVEVVPFGVPLCSRRLAGLGHPARLRMAEGRPFVTDNGNHILDCAVSHIEDPLGLESHILSIPGVVGTGLFVGMTDLVLVQDGDRVQERRR